MWGAWVALHGRPALAQPALVVAVEVVVAAASPVVGRLMDTRGPRFVILIGVLITAAGLAGATLIADPWHLYATLGLLVGIGANCMSYSVHPCSVTRGWSWSARPKMSRRPPWRCCARTSKRLPTESRSCSTTIVYAAQTEVAPSSIRGVRSKCDARQPARQSRAFSRPCARSTVPHSGGRSRRAAPRPATGTPRSR